MHLPHLKRNFQLYQWNYFFFRARITQFFCFWDYWFGRDSRSQFNNDTFSKDFFVTEVLGICLPYAKSYFQLHEWMFFSLGLKLPRFFCFWECWFGRYQRSQFENNKFFKSFFTTNFFSRDLISIKTYLVR